MTPKSYEKGHTPPPVGPSSLTTHALQAHPLSGEQWDWGEEQGGRLGGTFPLLGDGLLWRSPMRPSGGGRTWD